MHTLSELSSKQYTNTYDNAVIGFVYSTTEPKCITTKRGNTLYVRDVVLVDESKFGFTIKEWMGQSTHDRLYGNYGNNSSSVIASNPKNEKEIKCGDVVLYRKVGIKCRHGKQFYGVVGNVGNSNSSPPQVVVHFRLGCALITPIVVQSGTTLQVVSRGEKNRMTALNEWAKLHHSVLFSLAYDIFRTNNNLQKVISENDTNVNHRKRTHAQMMNYSMYARSKNLSSLEMLMPNRSQSFVALLKDVKVCKYKKRHVSSTVAISSVEREKDHIVLIFSDEDHIEVGIKCVQSYFQTQDTINQLLKFKDCVCRVENVFVTQAPFVNTTVSGKFREKIHVRSTMRTNIYCLEYSDKATKNVLINCGRLKPLHRISGYIYKLEMPNRLLSNLMHADDIDNNDDKNEKEYCILYIMKKKFKKRWREIIVDSSDYSEALNLTPPTSPLLELRVSLNVLSAVLLHGIPLKLLFQEQKLLSKDAKAKYLLGWRMLSSMMKTTPLSQFLSCVSGDDHEIPPMCFIVTKEERNQGIGKDALMIDGNNLQLQLVDMNILPD